MEKRLRINGHGHLLPEPEVIPTFMKNKEVFWVDADRKYMRQQNWSRPITDPSFFLKEKLEWMEKNKIDHEVVLNLSQLYCNGYNQQLAKDVIRFQNDFNASVQADHPDKFTTGFVVQAAYVEDALVEIERCVYKHNMTLLCLPTHFVNASGKWTSTADPSVEPIFELANELGLAMEIHPYNGPDMIKLEDQFWRFHLIWMCAQTADHYHMFSLLGYPQKYPKLRSCYAHGNQYAQVNIGRRKQGFNGRPDLFQGATHPADSQAISNVYYDTLVHDVYSLELLIKRQGVSQVVLGLDDPYPLGEMENVEDSYPGKVLDDAVRLEIITEKEKDSIWNNHIVNWLYGDRKELFYNRIKGKS